MTAKKTKPAPVISKDKVAEVHSDIMNSIQGSLSNNVDQRLNQEVATGIYHVLSNKILTTLVQKLLPDEKATEHK